MNTYYVATMACYVLVEATDEAAARDAGRPALQALYNERLGRVVPVEIRTVRLATPDEVADWKWDQETLAREAAWLASRTTG